MEVPKLASRIEGGAHVLVYEDSGGYASNPIKIAIAFSTPEKAEYHRKKLVCPDKAKIYPLRIL